MATAKKKTAASASTKASKAPSSVTLHGIAPYQPKANEEYMNDLQRAHFKLILNAIRDNEDKAEAMGIQTMKYKIIGWMISAFFCGLAGGIMGGLVGYIDSTDVAFDGREMGVFMVLMAILGGKGTLWGPVIGATIFHIFKEGFWTFFLGWQYVALGVLIVVIVIYFPEGIMGWLREKYPERFGEVVDEADRKAQVELK